MTSPPHRRPDPGRPAHHPRRQAAVLRARRKLLAVLDALHDASIDVTVCRQEGGATMMAEAQGKLTGKPGVCFVTRGPGATNAAAGVHIAHQDSTPLLLFVGQVARDALGREAFQELDYGAVFGTMAKWVVQIDDPARVPELVVARLPCRNLGPARPGGDRAARRHADRGRDGGRRAAYARGGNASGRSADRRAAAATVAGGRAAGR